MLNNFALTATVLQLLEVLGYNVTFTSLQNGLPCYSYDKYDL